MQMCLKTRWSRPICSEPVEKMFTPSNGTAFPLRNWSSIPSKHHVRRGDMFFPHSCCHSVRRGPRAFRRGRRRHSFICSTFTCFLRVSLPFRSSCKYSKFRGSRESNEASVFHSVSHVLPEKYLHAASLCYHFQNFDIRDSESISDDFFAALGGEGRWIEGRAWLSQACCLQQSTPKEAPLWPHNGTKNGTTNGTNRCIFNKDKKCPSQNEGHFLSFPK